MTILINLIKKDAQGVSTWLWDTQVSNNKWDSPATILLWQLIRSTQKYHT